MDSTSGSCAHSVGSKNGATPQLEARYNVENSRLLRFGKTDPQVERQRAGDLLGEEAPGGAARDAADDLAAQPAEIQRVIAKGGARIIAARLRGESCRHADGIGQIGEAERRVIARQSGGMRDDVANTDVVLAEFRPIA